MSKNRKPVNITHIGLARFFRATLVLLSLDKKVKKTSDGLPISQNCSELRGCHFKGSTTAAE
jgi:hypothetical protein